MTRFPSVAAWAASLGSKAKTRKGQKAAILASFQPVKPNTAWAWDRKMGRQKYYAQQRRRRQERFAANHPLTVSMPTPAQKNDVAPGRLVPLLSMSRESENREHARLGEWYISLREEGEWNNDRYSKSWHKSHGGVYEVSSRTVRIRRVRDDGTMEARDVEVTSWRGNFVLNALIEAGILVGDKSLMHIRLHAAYTLSVYKFRKNLRIYERSLNPIGRGQMEFVDFCAVWHGITFHGPTVRAAVAGLRTKLHSVIQQQNAPIDWALCKSLGFCDEGIKQFAKDFNLSLTGRYKPDQIAALVAADLTTAAKYEGELRRLASAVGYTIPRGWSHAG